MLVICECRVGLFFLLCLISYVVTIEQHGSPAGTLYVARDSTKNHNIIVYKRQLQNENEDFALERRKRDISVIPATQKNISTWTTHLNDSHQQLMVHWVGEGSKVIICLARDSSPRNKGGIAPSALFISYDYGKNFTNKTESFKLADTPDSGYAQLDKFFNHPKYPEFCVFVDTTNKKLYYTSDNGRNIHRSDLTFQPSDLAFDEELPDKFVVLDKVDPNRPLFLTLDGGKTFKQIHALVKTFFWSSGADFPKAFYVERWEPNGTSTVLVTGDPVHLSNAKIIFKDAKDFQIKGDYMFATRQSKERNTLELYISHQRKPFYKAEFETELDLRKFHVADVTDKRIFVSVMHTENLADLYVSEINNNYTQYRFVVSLEQILCYFPDGNWKDTWLEDVTEDPFTDLYRVEGLKGIYIASRVDSKAPVSDIGPEHLISLITFDHGATWSPINPPTEDENGKPLSCHIENSCSLHLCQKFSQLYPVTRSANIMSSKSAPGIIMATGVMGKSLKGIPGVYLSRDAGLTWKRILKDYYFFNYGDHGGVLVAVKYFKARGETRNILYSTNEGIEWNSYQFNEDDLRMYGLMTEPGENTTTFTMFGSANDQHQWIIITIDLKNAFDRNCTNKDYKFWSPSPSNMSVSCVLGQRDVFQRRIAHANCYNGIDYERSIKKEVCECSRRDFECDYGFMILGDECVRNRSMKYDPYIVPSDCRPGHFYKRTKGYRKIDGDVCTISSYLSYSPDMIPCPLEEPTEFILVALRDRIARIDLSDNSTLYPVKDQNNIVAIEFDMKNNCIYWADIEIDKISRQCFNGAVVQEVIVDTDLASIEGMALDWISNVLFFVDGMRKKIEAVRTDLLNEGRMRVTILDHKVLSKPRGIAVHPKAGYLFWTDWDRNSPSVSRSNLDGTNVKKLFGKPIVKWPNGITIDQMSERIYWVDAMEDYIASADLNGRYFRRIVWNDDKVSHPFAVAVLKDKVIWDDWKVKSIFIADKDSGANLITINNSSSGLMMMDLKVFAHFVQYGSNACSYKNTSCDTMCLGGPGNTFSCLCPDGFMKINGKCVCPNGMEPAANMTCPKKAGSTCGPDQFTCKSGMCISSMWRCDGNNDCGDLSDEIRCPICSAPMIACDDDTRCYLPHWKCDGDVDCADMSDEKDCAKLNCTESQFQCADGQCIDKKWLCDGDNDCKDGSDERNCSMHVKRTDTPVSCSGNTFPCGNDTNAVCIPTSWVCDGERDCAGGEDESTERCKDSTCAPYMFRCPSGKCIFKSWVCDGENDCSDEESSDEKNCTTIGRSKLLPRPNTDSSVNFRSTCLDWMFKCGNGNCVPYWWRCDSVDDCGDNSDELGCGVSETSSLRPIHEVTRQKCGKNRFSCSPGVCIPLEWVCDTAVDCPDGSDEVGCVRRGGAGGEPCAADETPCADGRGCVPDAHLCDGTPQCADKSDEAHCSLAGHDLEQICPAGYTLCDDGIRCIVDGKLCDGYPDCFDGTDEANCSTGEKTINKFIILGVDQASINSTSFVILCWKSQVKSVQYSFLPSISKVSTGVWRNLTWTDDIIYRFTDLEPFTNYNVTLYVRDSKSNETYALMKYTNATTGQGVPSPPLRLTIRQLVGSHVVALWDPPKEPRGIIKSYTLKYAPPLPPMEKTLHVTNNTGTLTLPVDGYFKPNVNYSFWVVATNDAATSEPSPTVYITFDEINDVDDLENVSMTRKDDSIFLQWHKIQSVDGYIISVRTPPEYPKLDDITTKENNVTLTNLPRGVELYVDVLAYKGTVKGKPFTIPLRLEGIPDELPSNVVAMLLKEKGTSVKLSWSPPLGDRYKNKELDYEIHYVNVNNYHGLSQYSNDTKIKTKNNSLVIDNLHACEGYVFSVGLAGGPAKVMEIITRENERAPIKNLHFSYNEAESRLHILWNANCDVIRNPVTYMLEITEETRNKTSMYELQPTKNILCSHIIENLPAGGRYSVCVYSSIEGSMRTCSHVRAREIPPPENVAAYRSQRGHIMVSWRHAAEDDADKNDQKYEVIVSDKEIPDDLLHPTEDMKVVTAKSSPMLVHLPEFQSATLFVAVRTLTEDGYYSGITEVHTLEMGGADDEDETSTAGALWWGCGAALVAGVALSAALVHLALKHRRLARSFLRFTAHTPRYDSRRGQATIADHDEDDVPPIQGFSDDEPLVIA